MTYLWHVTMAAVAIAVLGAAAMYGSLNALAVDTQLAMTLLLMASSFAIASIFIHAFLGLLQLPVTANAFILTPIFFTVSTLTFAASMNALVNALRAVQRKHGSHAIFESPLEKTD